MQAHKLDLHIHDITLITKSNTHTGNVPFLIIISLKKTKKHKKTISVRDISHKDPPPVVVGWWQKERDESSGSQFCRRLNLTAQTWKAGFFFLPPEGLRGF